jgi:hypothetical protein
LVELALEITPVYGDFAELFEDGFEVFDDFENKRRGSGSPSRRVVA